jgi:hypothetical protein
MINHFNFLLYELAILGFGCIKDDDDDPGTDLTQWSTR